MSKGVKMLIVSMTVIIILLSAGLYIFYVKGTETSAKGPTIDEIVASSVAVPEIVTNLASDQYIRIAFTIQTDSKDTKAELEKRTFQVNNIIIKQLSGMEAEELEGTKGKINLEEILKFEINSFLDEGVVEKVYITSAIIQ